MKEYGCCPKFKRGDNSTYTFTKGGGGMYLVSATTKFLLNFYETLHSAHALRRHCTDRIIEKMTIIHIIYFLD
jgi:hypothetical protein